LCLSKWALDARVSALSAIPVDILGSTTYNSVTGIRQSNHPNRVEGEPLYLYDAYPGGKQINLAAFANATSGGVVVEGDFPRNHLRAFDSINTDLALRKEFSIRDKVGLQFRAESFNLFNHTQFGNIHKRLSNGSLFGLVYNTRNVSLGSLNSLYQTGGPRSLQLALRLHF
jgi:hypothetical protein